MREPRISEGNYFGCLVSRSRRRGYIHLLAELCDQRLAFRAFSHEARLVECDPMLSLPLGTTFRFAMREDGTAGLLVPVGFRLIKVERLPDPLRIETSAILAPRLEVYLYSTEEGAVAGPYSTHAVYPQAALLGVGNTKPQTFSAQEILVSSNFCSINSDLECFLSFGRQDIKGGESSEASGKSDTYQEPRSFEPGGTDTHPFATVGTSDFVSHRLLPSLRAWFPSATDSHAQQLHDSVLNKRFAVVPSIPWARAYQTALGRNAILHIIYVSPLWLDFADAWSGGLAKAWRLATDKEVIVVVCLDQIDRTPSVHWCQPLFAGKDKEHTLPDGLGWPPNLLVFFTLARDEYAFPLLPDADSGCGALTENFQLAIVDCPEPLSSATPIDPEEYHSWAGLEGFGSVSTPKLGVKVQDSMRQGTATPFCEEPKPSSLQFLQDCLPPSKRRPENGSQVAYRRITDDEIWRRHRECLAQRGVSKLGYASSMLTKGEAGYYLRNGFFPDGPLRFEKKRGREGAF